MHGGGGWFEQVLTDVEFSEPEPDDVVRLNSPSGGQRADGEMSPAGTVLYSSSLLVHRSHVTSCHVMLSRLI